MILERNIHKFSSGIKLECGKSLASFDLMVDTYGELNSDKSNAILICHAFSGSHHAAGKSDDDENLGWWDNLIGPDKAIDTNKFFVVSPNNLGSCLVQQDQLVCAQKIMNLMVRIFQVLRF